MTDQTEERKRQYERTRGELIASQHANSEQFDRSILTLSTAFLAISIGFIRDIAPPESLVCFWLLYLSWFSFGATILVALWGLLCGQVILKRLIESAHAYYIKQKEDAYNISELLPKRIDLLNRVVGLLFSAAVGCTILFAVINFG